KLEAKALIKLNFSKNSEGKYHCPVLYSVFTNNSHILANKVTGNVFSYEAVEQLNIKTKSYKDLLTDEPFTRQDIITLQLRTRISCLVLVNYQIPGVKPVFLFLIFPPTGQTHEARSRAAPWQDMLTLGWHRRVTLVFGDE
ncbi:RING-type E3 ubiquitin-protein ligase PPIL2, partial [Tachysurus ichikawai]